MNRIFGIYIILDALIGMVIGVFLRPAMGNTARVLGLALSPAHSWVGSSLRRCSKSKTRESNSAASQATF
jgi:hypothetical protein